MKNTKCLIITCGFFGDIIFASSIAEKLKEEQLYSSVDYLIGFPQVRRLLHNNPFIDNVYVSKIPGAYPFHDELDYQSYDKIFQLQPLNYLTTPCEEFQINCGIKNPSPLYKIYTQPEYDEIAKEQIQSLKDEYNKPVIAVMDLAGWESKTYIFTKEQYIQGIDVPYLGYGGSHRDISYIIKELESEYTLLELGVNGLNQQQSISIDDENMASLLFQTSLLKYCDAFIGTDGGLATIAAGVETKTIITGDFNLQLYGWNGVLKKIERPRLGPYEYFGDPHIVLDPYLTDKEISDTIKIILNENNI